MKTETLALPHALGQEKSILSTLLQHPQKLAESHGITRETFYLEAHQIIFDTMRELAASEKEIELVSFVQHLIDKGQLENVGNPAAITELYSYAPTPAFFAQHCQELHEKHAERLLYKAGLAAQNRDEQEHNRLIQERDRIMQLASKRNVLMERLEALRYEPDATPPPDEICLKFMGIAVASRGNITAVQAKQKAGKSAFVSAIMGCAIRGNYAAQGDILGLEWQGEATGGILHLDTEQSRADWHASVKRAENRAGVPQTRRLHSFSIVTFQIAERMDLLGKKMQAMHEGKGIDCVIIDGVADLIADVNNIEQATTLVSQLMKLAHQYDCPIIVVIHENPSTEEGKTRGNLGSELQRKAFGNIRIDKDSKTSISTIYGTEMRKGHIPKEHGLCFAWDETAQMHCTLGIHSQIAGQQRGTTKAKEEREKWLEIFENAPENGTKGLVPKLSPEQAAKIIRDTNGTGKAPKIDTIRKQMERAETLGVLRKIDRGTWAMNETGQTGQ